MSESPELSFIIPVYNAESSIHGLVHRIVDLYTDLNIEIVLVNDGSLDKSEAVCKTLVAQLPSKVRYVHLARNFGEHNAVLAGLHQAQGEYVGILDDDGQNPPEEIRRMLAHLKANNLDVCYGRYIEKQHSWFRNFGSKFNDRMANMMLKKPREIYLSSFKVMNRFAVEQVKIYRGSFPYIDGLIFRATRHIGQIDVQHKESHRPSNYNLRRLMKLWLNMFLNFSITPLRLSAGVGLAVSALSLALIIWIIIDKLWITPDMTLGVPTILVSMLFLAGMQLLILGLVGEYLGRLFLDHSAMPQFVVRYVKDER